MNIPTSAKLTIISLDGVGGPITAQFNPKELALDKSVPWQKSPTASGDTPELQFTSAEGRSLSFELFFDGYETGQDVHLTHIEPLLVLTKVMDSSPGASEDKRRPPRVKVLWSTFSFEGVIESVATKYTMFLPSGAPCRCTASIKFKEATRAKGGKAGGSGGAT